MRVTLEQIGKELYRQRQLDNTTRTLTFTMINGKMVFVSLIKTFIINPIRNKAFYVGIKVIWYNDQKKDKPNYGGRIAVDMCPGSEVPLILCLADKKGIITVNDCYIEDDGLYIIDLSNNLRPNYEKCAGYCHHCFGETEYEQQAKTQPNCNSMFYYNL